MPPPTYPKCTTGKVLKTNVEVQDPTKLDVLRKRSKNRVTDAELSQVTLLSVAEPKMRLLGQPAIEKLNLVARINEIQSPSYEERIKATYPQLFYGLGELEGEYEIK